MLAVLNSVLPAKNLKFLIDMGSLHKYNRPILEGKKVLKHLFTERNNWKGFQYKIVSLR